ARPGSAADAARPIDGEWGLAPALAERVHPLFLRGKAAFFPFAGTDDMSRIHFETKDRIELGQGTGSVRDYGSGFLDRLAGVLGAAQASRQEVDRLSALAFTDQLPIVFRGAQPVANQSLRSVGKPAVDERQAEIIEHMYAGTR